jgi:hypothetical protein
MLVPEACRVDNIRVMNWGDVELEPEVDCFDTLDQDDKETAAFYVDLLAERGVLRCSGHGGHCSDVSTRRIRRMRSQVHE